MAKVTEDLRQRSQREIEEICQSLFDGCAWQGKFHWDNLPENLKNSDPNLRKERENVIKEYEKCAWKKKIAKSCLDIQELDEAGIPEKSFRCQDERIFENMGYAMTLDIRKGHLRKDLFDQAILCITDLKSSNSTYIGLSPDNAHVNVWTMNTPENKFGLDAKKEMVKNGKDVAINEEDIEKTNGDYNITEAKLAEELQKINPEFEKLWRSIIDKDDKEILREECSKLPEMQKANLDSVIRKKVTSQSLEKGPSFLRGLIRGIGKNKETDGFEK